MWDIITFVAETRQAVDYINTNWEPGDTVSFSGKIVNKTITQTLTNDSASGFGEPEEETRTYYKT